MAEQVVQNLSNDTTRHIFEYHLDQTKERLRELTDVKKRSPRSIDWLGSAWKWIAGSPDATDWNQILQTRTELVQNNNHQYRINRELFDATRETIERVNEVVSRMNNQVHKTHDEGTRQDLLGRITILKEEVHELIRACQMAKKGIVNTNLLNSEEVDNILNELEILPYQNVVEAIEYAQPSIYTNGTWMLYILSIPKVRSQLFHVITARASITNGTQVELSHTRLLTNHNETYGINESCTEIGNSTVCEAKTLKKLGEETCLPRLLKGGHANCRYHVNHEEVVELIAANTIFLTNFNGVVKHKNSSTSLVGTFLIQIGQNEDVRIKDQTFVNRAATSPQALPAVLSNVTNNGVEPDLTYIHDLSQNNIRTMGDLSGKLTSSLITELFFMVVVLATLAILWKKIYGKANLPTIQLPPQERSIPASQLEANTSILNRSFHSVIDLRDADI